MKKLYLCIPLLLLAFFHRADAAINFVSSSTAGATAASTAVTSTISTTAGNLLVVECRHGSTFVNPTNVTSTDQTTFTNFAISSNTAAGAISGYFGIASTTGSNTVRCNFASSVSNRNIAVMQYSGTATTNVLDTTSTSFSNSAVTSSTSGIYTTTNANDVIVTFVDANSDSNVTSVASPFIARFLTNAAFGTAGADNVVSTIQTAASVKWTFASSAVSIIVGAFKAAASAPAPTPRRRSIVITAN